VQNIIMYSVQKIIKMIDQQSIKPSFYSSLLWLALAIILALSVGNVVELIFVDFIHGNPHRPQSNAVEMMFIYPPIDALIAFIGVLLVFGIPQIFQAIIAKSLVKIWGHFGVLGLLAIVPMTAVLTWYCFDYLTPSDFNLGINVGADWVPYQHGITLKRYLITLGLQFAVTALTVVHFLTLQTKNRRAVLLSLICFAIIGGGFFGYHQALGQYKFL
jgi:hypothetical protein